MAPPIGIGMGLSAVLGSTAGGADPFLALFDDGAGGYVDGFDHDLAKAWSAWSDGINPTQGYGGSVADAVGARQVVIHSPYNLWFHQNRLMLPGYREKKQTHVRTILGPVLARAEALGVTLVMENIQDVDPFERLKLIDALASPALALSVDTGHAHLARAMSGAPPVDYFIRAAGARLGHVHLQDLDGHADRHWAPGDGGIAWRAVFAALADCGANPHLVLELRDKADIPRGFDWLAARGLAR